MDIAPQMTTRFSRPSIDAKALEYFQISLESGEIGGDGPFTTKCHEWLRASLGTSALLTHSCTGALEMTALLAEVGPGDEVIMPSYTFTSTANAFVLRGATPVFTDIREDTLNLDERLLAQAWSPCTKAIVPVHYAGVACDMDAICAFAKAHGLLVIEDAAQALGASHKGMPLGTLGDLGCLSFHVTKNVVSGEGGALILNNRSFVERAHIIREKGTNRTQFINHKVDKYEWLDLGSSYLPSDLLAAVLLSQLERSGEIVARRLAVWNRYHAAFETAERRGLLRRPVVPDYAGHNGHIYYLLLPDASSSEEFRKRLSGRRIPLQTHYVPLHSAPAGRRFGRTATGMNVTERTAATLVRLPIHAELSDQAVDDILGVALQAAGA